METETAHSLIFVRMISFENTEIAFAGKSDSDLKWSYRLFKILGKQWMVRLGSSMTRFALALRLPIKGIVKKTIFRQFCGGENITECEPKIAQLQKFNIGTILDYSVEGKEEETDFDFTRDEIIATIDKAASSQGIPFSVFKPTGLCRVDLLEKANDLSAKLTEAERTELSRALARVNQICAKAHSLGVPVLIDAEDFCYQDVIDRMAKEMMASYNNERAIVYNTAQMYRHDRLAFLKQCLIDAQEGSYFCGIKLVRGAYMEKERERAIEGNYTSPIQKDKESTDRDYDEALKFLTAHMEQFYLCAGTHNEKSSLLLTELLKEKGIAKNDKRVYFAQLLGMSDHLSYNLAHEGYNVAKYVPYGPVREVMPYLIRRAQENTSVSGQTGRELGLIIRERKRRKHSKKS